MIIRTIMANMPYILRLTNPAIDCLRPAIDVQITDTSFSEEHFDFVSGVLKFNVVRLGP